MTIGTYAQFIPTMVSRPASAPGALAIPSIYPSQPDEAPKRKVDAALAAERLVAMGQDARAALGTPRPKMNPFIGFRANMAKLRASGVVSVPVVSQ